MSSPLPEKWRKSKLSDFGKIVGGGTPSKSNEDYWGGSIPWASVKDLGDPFISETEDTITESGLDAGSRLIPPESVILSSRMTIGLPTVNQEKVAINQDLKAIPETDGNVYFLAYLLHSKEGYLRSLGRGTTVDGINNTELSNIATPRPPLAEQNRIASVLYSVDEHVRTLDDRHNTLTDHKQALMRDLLTGNRKVGLNADVREPVSETPQKPSDENWASKKLVECVDITMGNSPKSEHYNHSAEGKPFLQGNNEFGFRNPSPDRWCDVDKKIAQKGDVMVSIRAPVGDSNVADKDYVIGRGVAALSSTELNHEFLYQLIQSEREYLKRISVGSTFNSISYREFNHLEVRLPPLWEQERIASILYTVDEMIARTASLREEYERLKQGLMQDLLSGDVRTPEQLDVLESVTG